MALEYAEQELEVLRSMEDKKLALTAAPSTSDQRSTPQLPGLERHLRPDAAAARQLPQPGRQRRQPLRRRQRRRRHGQPGPTSFTSGDVSGKVYRYIVWRNDEKCSEANCPGKQDYKQIVVAVRLDTPGNQAAERGYVEVQSNFVNPTDNKENDPLPGANGKVVTAQQFFLTDTPCSSTGATARQESTGRPPPAQHARDLRQRPADGDRRKGAPDALLLGSPPDPDPEDLNNPLKYDYANDSYLETSPDTDNGRPDPQRRHQRLPLHADRDDQPRVPGPPLGHRPDGRKLRHERQGDARSSTPSRSTKPIVHGQALRLPLQTPRNRVAAGRDRHDADRLDWAAPPTGPTPGIADLADRTESESALTMTFSGAPYTIPAGDRLGVALSVERQRPRPTRSRSCTTTRKHPTRIEVDTSTPIDGG